MKKRGERKHCANEARIRDCEVMTSRRINCTQTYSCLKLALIYASLPASCGLRVVSLGGGGGVCLNPRREGRTKSGGAGNSNHVWKRDRQRTYQMDTMA